ncbi:MAG TPA: hypothetical protein VGB71_16890 [Flavisolibacter sp.]
MLVFAHHHITDAEGFWAGAKEVTKNLPASLKVLGIYPSRDRKTGTCLWEANSVKDVQDFLDENAGHLAKNYCYEVNVEESVGLPAFLVEDTQLS